MPRQVGHKFAVSRRVTENVLGSWSYGSNSGAPGELRQKTSVEASLAHIL